MDALHFDTQFDAYSEHRTFSLTENPLLSEEWLVPLRCNFWVQLACVLSVTGALSLIGFFTLDIDVLFSLALYSFGTSIYLLVITFAGRDTLRAYRQARGHMQKHGRFDKRLQRKYLDQMYCRRAGARAAAQDLGMPQELLPDLANAWRII